MQNKLALADRQSITLITKECTVSIQQGINGHTFIHILPSPDCQSEQTDYRDGTYLEVKENG
jgi:hypothetical protein